MNAKILFHNAWVTAVITGGTVLLGYLSVATQIHNVQDFHVFLFTVGGAVLGAVGGALRVYLAGVLPQLLQTITTVSQTSPLPPQATIITATTNVPENTSVTQIQPISDPSVTRQPMAMSSAPISESTDTPTQN